MNIKKLQYYINRPEYFFRPHQIYSRIFNLNTTSQDEQFKYIDLPWGSKIKISTDKSNGIEEAILRYGIYDLSLSEALYRLTNLGELAIDIGANIGYMTSIMSKQVGQDGKVLSFEPNPDVYKEFCENVKSWGNCQGWGNVYTYNIALSNHTGSGILNIISTDTGLSFIDNKNSIKESNLFKPCRVELKKLDEILEQEQKSVGILKIDVEGHELEVFKGARASISQRKIRDILFEDHNRYPSKVTQFLEGYDYTIFQIWKGFWKPILVDPRKNLSHPWEPSNYLATHNPNRAISLFKENGWKLFCN